MQVRKLSLINDWKLSYVIIEIKWIIDYQNHACVMFGSWECVYNTWWRVEWPIWRVVWLVKVWCIIFLIIFLMWNWLRLGVCWSIISF